MQHLKSHPPLGPLLGRVERLERAGVVVALGGSGLLAALGLADTAQDWDLTTDAPLHAVLDALEGEPWTHHGPDDLHAYRAAVAWVAVPASVLTRACGPDCRRR